MVFDSCRPHQQDNIYEEHQHMHGLDSCPPHQQDNMRKTERDWMVSREFFAPSYSAVAHYLWRYFVNCFEVSHTWHIVWMAGCVVVSIQIQISSQSTVRHVIAKSRKSKNIKDWNWNYNWMKDLCGFVSTVGHYPLFFSRPIKDDLFDAGHAQHWRKDGLT